MLQLSNTLALIWECFAVAITMYVSGKVVTKEHPFTLIEINPLSWIRLKNHKSRIMELRRSFPYSLLTYLFNETHFFNYLLVNLLFSGIITNFIFLKYIAPFGIDRDNQWTKLLYLTDPKCFWHT